MERRILVLVNANAGQGNVSRNLYEIVRLLSENGCEVTIYPIIPSSGLTSETIIERKGKGFESVLVCGGDGTMNHVINSLAKNNLDIPIGYLPFGSTNDFAETLGIPSVPTAAAVNICKSDLMGIDVGKFGRDRYFSYIATFGAFSAASYSAPQELKNSIGHMAYLIEGLKQLGNMQKYHAVIKADGRKFEDDYIYCSVSNTRSVAGIVKLADNLVDLHDGMFEVILVKYPRDISETSKIISGVLSSDFSNDMFEFFKAEDVKVTMDEGTAWSLDGEKVDAPATVRIRNLASAIKMYL